MNKWQIFQKFTSVGMGAAKSNENKVGIAISKLWHMTTSCFSTPGRLFISRSARLTWVQAQGRLKY